MGRPVYDALIYRELNMYIYCICIYNIGWSECQWSTELKQCLCPSYVPLKCLGGLCGTLLSGSKDQCPVACDHYTTCQNCLQHSKCGWCSLNPNSAGSSDVDSGNGICLEGTLEGPLIG